MTIDVQRTCQVIAEETIVAHTAGAEDHVIKHMFGGVSGSVPYHQIWSQRFSLQPVTPVVLDLQFLSMPGRVEVVDLFTGQDVRLLAVANHAAAMGQIIVSAGSDNLLVLPVPSNQIAMFECSDGHLFGQHADRIQLMMLAGPAGMDLLIATQQAQ